MRILFVDDQEDDYLLTQRRLACSHGAEYTLEWVSDYDTALALMCRNEHDAYLVDYRLGIRSGLDLLREALAQGCAAPIIMLTGQGEYAIDVEAMRAGAADYLVKDQVAPELLERSIRHAIERKRAERELRQAQEQLEAAIRAQHEFMTLVAHDLKAPLAGISGFAQLLQRRAARLGPGTAEQLADGLDKIDATVQRAVTLIDQLMDATRLRQGESLVLQPRPTDLVALVRSVVAEHQGRRVRHRIVVDSDLPHLIGDWDTFRLERIIDNLLANALKYSPAGTEIVLRVACSSTDGNWAILQVRDAGIGIPAADLPHVFEPYYRARNVGGRTRGTGIGLAGVRQIVEMHGGTIEVDSQEGRSSTFTVRLPLGAPTLPQQ